MFCHGQIACEVDNEKIVDQIRVTGIAAAMLVATLGCESKTDPSQPESPTGAAESPATDDVLASLSQVDRDLAAAQQGLCPVSGEPLGSMGPPVKVTVEGRHLLICCAGCEEKAKTNFDEYIGKLRSPSEPGVTEQK